MAACFGCRCNTCARNVNITPGLFTPGEVDECCFNCDDCMATNGTARWDPDKGQYSGRWKGECQEYLEPKKYAEQKARAEREKANAARRSLRVVKPGSK